MQLASVIGSIGATLTTVAGLPQLIKSYKTRHTKDLAMGMCLAVDVGTLLWTVYGFMLNQPPIYIANIITFLIYLGLVSLKLIYG